MNQRNYIQSYANKKEFYTKNDVETNYNSYIACMRTAQIRSFFVNHGQGQRLQSASKYYTTQLERFLRPFFIMFQLAMNE